MRTWITDTKVTTLGTNIQQNENLDKLLKKMFYRQGLKIYLYNLTKDILLTEEYIS